MEAVDLERAQHYARTAVASIDVDLARRMLAVLFSFLFLFYFTRTWDFFFFFTDISSQCCESCVQRTTVGIFSAFPRWSQRCSREEHRGWENTGSSEKNRFSF